MRRLWVLVLGAAVAALSVAACGQSTPTAIPRGPVKPLLSADATSPWSMSGHDPQHTGRSTLSGPPTRREKWVFYVGDPDEKSRGTYWTTWRAGPSATAPVIAADGTVYVAGGAIVPGGRGAHSGPQPSRSTWRVYAVNPDGSEKWRFAPPPGDIEGLSVGRDGTIYCGAHKWLCAISANGRKKWDFPTRGYVRATVIGDDGTIYFCSDKLYAVNPDGTKKWDAPMSGGNSSPTIARDGTIYVGDFDGRLYAVRPDGTKKWTCATGCPDIQHIAVASDGTVYLTGLVGKSVIAITPSGTKKWEYRAQNLVCAPAIGTDGTVYVGSFDAEFSGQLHAIRPDGKRKWACTTGDRPLSSAATIGEDGTIYVGGNDGFYAVSPDGTKKWWFGRSADTGAAIGRDGTIYLGSSVNLVAVGPRK